MEKGVGGEVGKGNGSGCSAAGEHLPAGSFVLRLLSLWQAGIFGEGFSRIFISSPGAFGVPRCARMSALGGGGIILWPAVLLLLSCACLALMGFLLFVPDFVCPWV